MSTRAPRVLIPSDLDEVMTKRGPRRQMVTHRWYSDAVLDAGGLPLVPPPIVDAALLDELVELADALVLPGGGFDIDPVLYGEEKLPACGELLPERTNFERSLLTRALKRGLPVLGICGGMQLLNVERGGTLWQDLRSQTQNPIAHQQVGPKSEAGHDVVVGDAPSLLQRLVGRAGTLGVNSTHHQAVKVLGRGLVATAHDPHGLVEAFEDPSMPFFLGVQWHPEAMPTPAQQAIYRGLIDAARAAMAERRDAP